MNVAVFCSCSAHVSPMFLSEMERLGQVLAEAGHAVIYGGSSGGCMGALGDGVKRGGGRLIGVIPELDFMDGLLYEALDEKIIVPCLSSRKSKMNDLADAFIIYPGGIGTLDEAFTVLALKSSGNYPKPIIFYNFLDAWTPLLEAMDLLAQQKLVRHSPDELLIVLDKPEQVRDYLK